MIVSIITYEFCFNQVTVEHKLYTWIHNLKRTLCKSIFNRNQKPLLWLTRWQAHRSSQTCGKESKRLCRLTLFLLKSMKQKEMIISSRSFEMPFKEVANL